jgi:hypothetical protein
MRVPCRHGSVGGVAAVWMIGGVITLCGALSLPDLAAAFPARRRLSLRKKGPPNRTGPFHLPHRSCCRIEPLTVRRHRVLSHKRLQLRLLENTINSDTERLKLRKSAPRTTIDRAGRHDSHGSRLAKWRYCTALIMSKIGRYMATTMPPTTTPRNTIITGSINESRFDTAASTSSS